MDTPTARLIDTTPLEVAFPISEVRSRLLRAADLSAEAAGSTDGGSAELTKTPVQPIRVTVCPHCRAQLINPTGLEGGTGCGFCGPSKTTSAPSPAESPAPGVGEMLQIVLTLPGWLTVLLGGGVAVVLYTISLSHLLPDPSPLRSQWGATLLLTSLAVFGLCQLWILVKLIPTNDTLSLRDLLDITGLWGMAVRQLPETRWPIWLAAWAVVLATCSVAVIGGQKQWLLSNLPERHAEP
ncbi:MAG: hypothetical protein ACJ8F7_01885 [Gemmataceae bacterium]